MKRWRWSGYSSETERNLGKEVETIGAVLKNDNQKIELKVTGYEMPVPTKNFEDNNWLVCQYFFMQNIRIVR